MMDVSEALDEWMQTVELSVIEQKTVDFVPANTVVTTTIEAVIQAAQPETLKIDRIDYSKAYVLVHSRHVLQIDNVVHYEGKQYKLISITNMSGYGYFEAIGEELKK